jgi:hypothetical protein
MRHFLDSFDLMFAHAKPRISTRFTYPPAPAKGLDAWCGWLRREAATIAWLDFVAGSAQYHGLCGLSARHFPISVSAERRLVRLALELGKGEKHIEGEPAHAGSCIERLGDWHEGHSVLVKQLDQLGEIGERAGQAIDLIDHHDGDFAGPDIGKEVLQCRAVEGKAPERPPSS